MVVRVKCESEWNSNRIPFTQTGRRLGDLFRERLHDLEKDDKNASKPVGLRLKRQLSNLFTVANSHYQLS